MLVFLGKLRAMRVQQENMPMLQPKQPVVNCVLVENSEKMTYSQQIDFPKLPALIVRQLNTLRLLVLRLFLLAIHAHQGRI
jgi:hypothetical protein